MSADQLDRLLAALLIIGSLVGLCSATGLAIFCVLIKRI